MADRDDTERERAAAETLIGYGLLVYRNVDPDDRVPYTVASESSLSLVGLEAFAAMLKGAG